MVRVSIVNPDASHALTLTLTIAIIITLTTTLTTTFTTTLTTTLTITLTTTLTRPPRLRPQGAWAAATQATPEG